MAPTRALLPDASSSWGGRWECGLGGHPPMLGTHLPFQVWPDRALMPVPSRMPGYVERKGRVPVRDEIVTSQLRVVHGPQRCSWEA